MQSTRHFWKIAFSAFLLRLSTFRSVVLATPGCIADDINILVPGSVIDPSIVQTRTFKNAIALTMDTSSVGENHTTQFFWFIYDIALLIV